MLLVDDHEPQALEGEPVLQELVGADDDVDLALAQVADGRLELLLRSKTRELLDPHRPVREAVLEALVVLLGEQGGGHQHRDLPAVLHRDEGGAHGHLRLAEAHVAAHQPVHRPSAGHVGDHRVDGGLLVGGLLEGEGLGEGLVGEGVEVEPVPLARGPPGVELQQLGGDVVGLLGSLAPGLLPLAAAQLVERGQVRVRAAVPAHEMQGGDGDVEQVSVGVLQGQELRRQLADGEGPQSAVAPDPVLLVHHRRAEAELGEVADEGLGVAGRGSAAATLQDPLSEELGLGDERDGRLVDEGAGLERRHGDGERRGALEKACPTGSEDGVQAVPAQQVQQGLAPAGGLRHEQRAARELGEKTPQRREGVVCAGVDRQPRRGPGPVGGDAPRGLAARQRDLGHGLEGREDLLGLQEQVLRREEGAFPVVPPLFVAVLHLVPEPLRRPGEALHADRERVGREIVEEGVGTLEEQGQVVLDSPRGESAGDVAVDGAAARVARETLAPGPPEPADAVLVQGDLPGREPVDRVHPLGGALGLGVEGAQAVDAVVEQVDPVGDGAAHGEQVDQGAAHRELPVLHHLPDAAVPRGLQAHAQALHVQALAHVQDQAAALQVGAWGHPGHGGGGGDEHHAGPHGGQPVERREALGDDVLVGGEQVVGQCLPVREAEQGPVRLTREEEPQVLFQAVGGGRVRRQDQDRSGPACGRPGDGQPDGGAVQPRPPHPVAGTAGKPRRQGTGAWGRRVGGRHQARRAGSGRRQSGAVTAPAGRSGRLLRKGLVGTVAEGRGRRAPTPAEPDPGLLGQAEGDRGEPGAPVGPVAEGLVCRPAAGAPPVLAGLELQRIGEVPGGNRLGHGVLLVERGRGHPGPRLFAERGSGPLARSLARPSAACVTTDSRPRCCPCGRLR